MPAAQTTKLRPRCPGAASQVHPRGHAGTQAQGPAPPRPGPSTGGDHGAKEHRQLTNVARLPSADKDTRQCPAGRPHRRTPRRALGSARPLPRCRLPAWLPPIEGSRPAPWSQRCRGFPPRRTAGSRVRTPVLSPGPVCETPVESPWGAGTALDAGRPRTCWTRR